MAEKVIAEHHDLKWIPKIGVKVGFLESDRQKKKSGRLVLGECILVKDLYRCFIPYDFLIVIYAPNVIGMTKEQMKILLYHEMLHIGISDDGEDLKYEVRNRLGNALRMVIMWQRKQAGRANMNIGSALTVCFLSKDGRVTG